MSVVRPWRHQMQMEAGCAWESILKGFCCYAERILILEQGRTLWKIDYASIQPSFEKMVVVDVGCQKIGMK